MKEAADASWYNVLLIFSTYSIVLGMLARVLRMKNILGAIYAVAILLAYATKEAAQAFLPLFTAEACIYIAAFGLLVTNFLVESDHSKGDEPPRGV